MEVIEFLGASQVTAFVYGPDKVQCLLSRNFISDDKGGSLAAAYLEGWYRHDPLYRQIMEAGDSSCEVQRLDDLKPHIEQAYLERFFGAPGFRDKTAILIVDGMFRMVLNIYFIAQAEDSLLPGKHAVGDGFCYILGRTLATHFQRSRPPEAPLPLAVLSERERQVCLGMLAGKKAEIIAEEIGIGPSSVVTYRQRAYQKLGISSRGQLFAICGPGTQTRT